MTKNRCYQRTQEQRYGTEAYPNVGENQTEMSILLGDHKSTVSRERNRKAPKRGRGAKVYSALNAQKKTMLQPKEKSVFCFQMR